MAYLLRPWLHIGSTSSPSISGCSSFASRGWPTFSIIARHLYSPLSVIDSDRNRSVYRWRPIWARHYLTILERMADLFIAPSSLQSISIYPATTIIHCCRSCTSPASDIAQSVSPSTPPGRPGHTRQIAYDTEWISPFYHTVRPVLW